MSLPTQPETLLPAVMVALDVVVLESTPEGALLLVAPPPPWLERFAYPAPAVGDSVDLPDRFPFLGDFLREADLHWATTSTGRLRSGLWTECDRSGAESHFEATALHVAKRRILLIERVDADYYERRDVLQKARHGKLEAGRIISREMGERADAERRVHQLQAQLAHVARVGAMGEMAASLAHELNQPLWAIINYVQAASNLVDVSAEASRVKSALGKAVEQAERAGAILRGLRAFIAEGPPQTSSVAVNDLIHEVVNLLNVELRHGRIELELRLGDSLPAVMVDPIQVQQVVFNLVRNAIEAMAESSKAARRVTVSTRLLADGRVEVEVADTGPGCSPQVLARILEPFFTTKPGGMGVGLAISKTIVEVYGGHLRAETNASGGLSFRFDLPTTTEPTR